MAVLGICTITRVEGAGSGFRLVVSVAATDGSGQSGDATSSGEAIQGNLSIAAINDVAKDTAKLWLQEHGVVFGPPDDVQII